MSCRKKKKTQNKTTRKMAAKRKQLNMKAPLSVYPLLGCRQLKSENERVRHKVGSGTGEELEINDCNGEEKFPKKGTVLHVEDTSHYSSIILPNIFCTRSVFGYLSLLFWDSIQLCGHASSSTNLRAWDLDAFLDS